MISDPDLPSEGQALLMSTEEGAQEALVQMKHHRRTLKEARNKQHQVRMSGRYYKASFKPAENKINPKSNVRLVRDVVVNIVPPTVQSQLVRQLSLPKLSRHPSSALRARRTVRTWWKGRPRIVLLLLEEVKTCVTEGAYGMNETHLISTRMLSSRGRQLLMVGLPRPLAP